MNFMIDQWTHKNKNIDRLRYTSEKNKMWNIHQDSSDRTEPAMDSFKML